MGGIGSGIKGSNRSENKVCISVKVPDWLSDHINSDAAKQDRSVSWIVRDCLTKAYEQAKPLSPAP